METTLFDKIVIGSCLTIFGISSFTFGAAIGAGLAFNFMANEMSKSNEEDIEEIAKKNKSKKND